MDAPQHARRLPVALVAAAVVAGALLARGGVGDNPVPEPMPESRGEAETPAGAWREVARPPVRWTSAPTVVWTGTEALVLAAGRGGAALLLAYEPDRDRWREAAQPPIEPRGLGAVVWAGDDDGSGELVVWGGQSRADRIAVGDGAAYDPGTDRWRVLPDAPLAPRAAAAVGWNGEEVLIVGGVGGGVRRHDGAAYDPSSDTWRPIAGLPPSGPLLGHATVDEARWLAVVAAHEGGARLLRYNPRRDRWRSERLPLSAASAWTLAPAGTGFVAWGGRSEESPAGIVWDGPGEVRPLTAGHAAPRRLDAAAWTGEHVVGWDAGRGTGAALDPRTGAWTPLAAAPVTASGRAGAAWTGEELLVIGGAGGNGSAAGAAAWRPGDVTQTGSAGAAPPGPRG